MTIAVAAIAGLVVGSFLNVVIYRLPRGESLVRPGSHCPACGHALGALENIPIFSWLALRGKCRSCGAPIPIRYPLVELLTSALFALAMLEYGLSVASVAICVLGAFLVAMTFIDLDHLLIPDSLAYSAGAVGIVFAVAERTVVPAIEGLAVFAALLGAIYLATRGAGLGLGDVKMAGAIGLFIGFPTALAAAIGSFVVGALLAIVLGVLALLIWLLLSAAPREAALARLGAIASLAHERCDGSGYHRGLAGPAIPVAGRLLAAACAYRAMTEPRSYRPAMTAKQATTELRGEVRAGRLDAGAVEAVLAGA